MTIYPIVKALHLIFMVTWFAALFYVPRLYIYFVEANKKPEPERSILQKQFLKMAKRLWLAIGWPSMILVLVFGIWTLVQQAHLMKEAFMHLKLTFVAILILYHHLTWFEFKRLKKGIIKYSSFKLRLWNEIATLLLISIIFVISLRNTIDWIWGAVGLAVISAIIFLFIYLYKKKREKNQ